MNRIRLAAPVSVAALVLSALPHAGLSAEYHWNKINGSGDWHNTSCWTDADGNAVSTYPGQDGAVDSVVFHGLNMAGRVYITKSDLNIHLSKLTFQDGNTTLLLGKDIPFHIDVMEFSDHATFGFMAEGYGAFEAPNDFIIGNRDALLINGDGLIPGTINYQNQASGNWSSRRILGIDETGKLLTNKGDTPGGIDLYGHSTRDHVYGLFYGNWGDFRNISFKHAGTWTLTVPTGSIIPMSQYSAVGAPSDEGQGTVSTLGRPLYFWPVYVESAVRTNYFRAKIDAPKFLQCGSGCTVLFDDHTDDTCSYDVTAGILQLGGDLCVGNTSTIESRTCQLGPGAIDIRWDGTVRVTCENALNRMSTLHFHSFRERGADPSVTDAVYGKLALDGHDATVRYLYIDGNPTINGTYGSSESEAQFKRDDLFTGTGVLTVRLSQLKGTKFFIW